MQTRLDSIKLHFSGMAALLAGFLYSSRWVCEISTGVLKNKQHSPSFISQNFFVVKLLLMFALLEIAQLFRNNKLVFTCILISVLGSVWTSVTRTIEAYGASGPWGFYSSPGLFLFFAGTLTAGLTIPKAAPYGLLGRVLKAISILYLLGSATSMLLFNLFGRDEGANRAASFFANLFLVGEGISWMFLGLVMFNLKHQIYKKSLHSAP